MDRSVEKGSSAVRSASQQQQRQQDQLQQQQQQQQQQRRAYNMLSSIINLSTPAGGGGGGGLKTRRGESSPQQSSQNRASAAVLQASKSNAPTSSTNHVQKISSSASSGDEAKKKKNNQYPSVGSQTSSPVKSPKGPAPRTLSILTALNELAIRGEGSGVAVPRHHPAKVPLPAAAPLLRSPLNLPTPPAPSSTGPAGPDQNHSSCSPIYSSPTSIRHHPNSATSRNPNDKNIIIPFSSTPRRAMAKAFDKNSRLGRSIASINSFQRSKSKERTPDWIWKIFQLAKHGKLEELQQSLQGLEPMDPTMLRHLVDGKGNTLLHCAARAGHVFVLQWLVSTLGPHTEAVLSDKNRAGRNVLLTALKSGQLKCFQWLVLQCVSGDKGLVPKEGERSLLHFAANYGNEPAVRWLIEQMTKRNVCVDIKDSSGFTPLHMAAKSGSITVCHTLITLGGADPYSETELGWRPSDLALRHRQLECANYLMMTEAASSLGSELYQLISVYKNLRTEHECLRQNFREVLRVGKSLVKERVELIKSFPSSPSSPSNNNNVLEASLLLGNNGSSRFSGLEHKLVKAEQAWKRIEVQVDKFPTLGTPVTTSPSSLGPCGGGGGTSANMDGGGGTLSSGGGSGYGGNETPPVVDMMLEDSLLENTNSPNILQKRLAGLQSRRDKNFTSQAFLSASSSDDDGESSATSTSSEEEEEDDYDDDYDDDQMSNSQHHRHHHPQHYATQSVRTSRSQHPIRQLRCNTTTNTTTTTARSTTTPKRQSGIAPWLLPPDDHLLTALSPIVNDSSNGGFKGSSNAASSGLDLLRVTPPKHEGETTSSFNLQSSFKSVPEICIPPGQKSTSADMNEGGITTGTPEIAVLEVIEPGSKVGSHFTPDLLRRSNGNKGGIHGRGSCPSPVYSSTSHSGLEEIYGEIKGLSNGPRSNNSSSCDEKQLKSNNNGMLSALSQSTRVALTANYVTLPRAASECGAGNNVRLKAASVSTKSPSVYSWENRKSDLAVEKEKTHANNYDNTKDSSDSGTCAQTSEEANRRVTSGPPVMTDDASATAKVPVPPLPPIIKRSHSSAGSSRILPAKQDDTELWSSREPPPSGAEENTDYTHPLLPPPSSSEASRTEIVLAPPSLSSQNAGVSEMESSNEKERMPGEEDGEKEENKVKSGRSNGIRTVFLNDPSNYLTSNDPLEGKEETEKGGQMPVPASVNNVGNKAESGTPTTTEAAAAMVITTENDNTASGGRNIRSESSATARKGNSGHHHRHHHHHHHYHHHQKSGRSPKSRGPPKPWYEIEGSDEEGSHLLRVVQATRSSSNGGSRASSTTSTTTNTAATAPASRHNLVPSLSSENETETSAEEQENNHGNSSSLSQAPDLHFI